MAKSPSTTSDKPKQKRGPQKRVLHIFYKVGQDGNGNPTADIVNVLTDAKKVIEFIDTPEYASEGIKRFKYEIISTPRGGSDGEEDHTGTASAAE